MAAQSFVFASQFEILKSRNYKTEKNKKFI